MKKAAIPLVIFIVLVVFLAIGLTRNPRELPSPLIGKPAPLFDAPGLHPARAERFSPKDMLGQVWILNVWASWCVACRVEHPVLMDLAKSGAVRMIGLDYKDLPEKGREWLAKFGDPYMLSAVDNDGRIGIDYGVYGVPETYLIDKAGVIRFKQVGPVTPEVVQDKILPLVKELQK
ncbi:MAG: DsbE family thiol:disulfide interchange protein [Burkholderiales bacterium]|nr:DsbE family thiol:disulfide interchange protein [Burkholderiales bacterium]